MLTRRKLFFIFIGCLVSFCAVMILWPTHDKLPVLATINDYQLEDVFHGPHQLNNEKVKVTAFFYTRCPDICPLTMQDFTKLQSELKLAGVFGDEVEIVSISFDPEYDTTENLRDYAERFQADSEGWRWLRGTQEATRQLANELQVQYEQMGEHFFSHSTTMFLIDQNNQVRALYDMAYRSKPVEIERIVDDVLYLVNKSNE